MIGSFTQGYLLPMMTPATILRRVGRVDFEQRSASFFRFARELLKELRPCRVGNTFCQTMIVDHPIDMQIFNTFGTICVDNLATLLVREVVTSPFGSFMHTSDHLAMRAPLFGSLLQSGMFALNLCLRLNRMGVKKMPKCPIPSHHQKERPFIPGLRNAGLSGPSL